MNIAIAGTHTGIGKTICSAVICKALGFDYWKPVQAGLEDADSDSVKILTAGLCKIHPEAYRLKEPASPHYAAQLEGISISLNKIQLPSSSNSIVVETAGGLMSPLAKDI